MVQPMSEQLDQLIHSTPHLWKGRRGSGNAADVLSTGHEALDRVLPGGGWPVGGVMEFLPQAAGIGELSLMLPAMKTLMQTQRRVLMVAAPYLPYAPALDAAGLDLDFLLLVRPCNPADALWAAEKALLHPACGMVLLWAGAGARQDESEFGNGGIRRLQVAARQTRSILVLYRSAAPAAHRLNTPWAVLRLALSRRHGQLWLDLLKIRGSCARIRLGLDLRAP